MISEFKTKNGRAVYDGGGISPDIDIAPPLPANITVSLYINNLIFDYATYFADTHDSIPKPDKFEITDAIYNDFIAFLKDKTFNYNTLSNDKLDELVATTKREGYYTIAEKEINALREKLSADKNSDLKTFSPEIKDLLREEIASRYYYQTGRIIAGLKHDPQLDMAVKLLEEAGTVNSILHGTYKEGEIKLAKTN